MLLGAVMLLETVLHCGVVLEAASVEVVFEAC